MENDNLKNTRLVYSAAVLYAIITGLSFLFSKVALSHADPIDMLAHRFTTSFIVVAILLISKVVKVDYSFERIKKILPLAILYPMSFFAFQTFGLQYASSSEAGILIAAAPVFTLILSSFILGEKSTTLQKISVLVSVTGVIYITLMKTSSFEVNSMKGTILLVLSALSFSGYSVMARILTKDFSNTELSFMMITISFVVFNIIAVGKNLMAGTLGSFLNPFTDIGFILSIVYLGVLSSLVTSLLTNYVLSKIEASKMSVFSNLGTVISIVAGVVFLKEDIFYYHIIGSILIIAGVIGTNFLDKKSIDS